MKYELKFHVHASRNMSEQFIMLLNERGINIEKTGERDYILTAIRQGKLKKLQSLLFKSAYTNLFNVAVIETLKNESESTAT